MNKQNTILIVDDEIGIINSIKRILNRSEYEVYSTNIAEEALEIIKKNNIDLIICDQRMPSIQGTALLEQVKCYSPSTIRFLMSGYSDMDTIISAINNGNIYYYINKPWDNKKLSDSIAKALDYKKEQDEKDKIMKHLLKDKEEWAKLMNSLNERIEKNFEETVNSLLMVIKAKDKELYEHSKRVSKYALYIANLMGFTGEKKKVIKYAGLFHDIGKIAIRDKILYKTGKLDSDEFEEMKNHSKVSAEILREANFLSHISDIVEQHHERIAGKGYPYGIKGEDILVEAKIIAIADTYDALTSDRVYRKGMSKEEALEIINENKNYHYDSYIVDSFIGGLLSE